MSPLRTISGRSNSVVVVGAGLSGLAAALHLRGSGRDVTVLERDPAVGGRVGTYAVSDSDGRHLYDIDNGASVLTMPNLVADALAAVGADFTTTVPALKMKKLTPTYHTRYSDGTHINVYSDVDRMAAEVERVCGRAEADGYRKLRAWLEDVFEAEFDGFIDSNFDSPLNLVSSPSAVRDVAKLVAMGGFGRLGSRVDHFISDERLRRIFTFQALYAGVAPSKALAVYGAIAHMDTSLGVYFPEGGMRSIALAMADALTTAGGIVHTNTEVAAIDFLNGRARSVTTTTGQTFECDVLILTPDLPVVDRLLGTAHREARSPKAAQVSPSAVVVHGTVPVSVTEKWESQAHHTIDFGSEWTETFKRITAGRGRGSLMSDPSLLITRPSFTDTNLRVTRFGTEAEPISVLAPCPNLDSAPLDWSTLTEPYVREILLELESRGYTGLSSELTVDHIDTPATWLGMGMAQGSPFASAHTFRQTGPFRRRNLVAGADNIVLAGCGTTPGVGVPTVLISGKLAAERVIGRVPSRADAPEPSQILN